MHAGIPYSWRHFDLLKEKILWFCWYLIEKSIKILASANNWMNIIENIFTVETTTQIFIILYYWFYDFFVCTIYDWRKWFGHLSVQQCGSVVKQTACKTVPMFYSLYVSSTNTQSLVLNIVTWQIYGTALRCSVKCVKKINWHFCCCCSFHLLWIKIS